MYDRHIPSRDDSGASSSTSLGDMMLITIQSCRNTWYNARCREGEAKHPIIAHDMSTTVDFYFILLLSVAHLNGRTFQQYQSTLMYIMSSQRSYTIRLICKLIKLFII